MDRVEMSGFYEEVFRYLIRNTWGHSYLDLLFVLSEDLTLKWHDF
jgi:hypothetical protein